MDELQGRQSRLVDVVGVNAPELSVQGLQRSDPLQIQDTSAQNFEQTRQNVQSIYESQLKMQAEYAQQSTNAALSRGQSRTSADLEGVAKAVLGATEFYKKQEKEDKEAAEKKATAEAKALIEQRSMLARAAVQDSLLTMHELIATKGREEGINTTELAINDIIDVQFATLPPESRSALRDIAFAQLQQEREKAAERQINSATELRNSQIAHQRTSLQVNGALILANVANASTPEEAAQQFQAYVTFLSTNTQGLSDQERLTIVNPLMEQAAVRIQARGDEYAGTLVKVQAIQQFYAALPGLRAQYGTNPDAWAFQTQSLATTLGVPELANGALSSLGLLQETNQYNAANQTAQQHANTVEGQMLDREFPGYLASASAIKAFEFINDPNSTVTVNRILAAPAEYSPILVQAATQAQEFRKAQEENRRLTTDLRSQTERVANYTRRATPEEQSNTRVVLGRDYLGNATGEVSVIQIPNVGLVVPRPDVSQTELIEAMRTAEISQANLMNLNREWAARGFNLNQPSDDSQMNIHRTRVSAFNANQANAAANEANLTPIQQNFNSGAPQAATGAPPPRPLLRQENRVLPFRPDVNVVVTSPYGQRHGRLHAGVDFGFTGQSRNRRIGVATVSGGTVIASRRADGYHTMVQVRTADGYIEEYGHLWGTDVREGDTVAPGQQIAWLPSASEWYKRDGDRTEGNHLHFTVRQPGARASNGGNSIEPLEYLEMRAAQPAQRQTLPGLGLPPNQLNGGRPSSAALMPGGQPFVAQTQGSRYVIDPRTGFYMRAAQANTPSAPARTALAPIQRSAYPARSNPTANYGYGQLRDNPRLARAFAEVADDIGFPAQWLVDIAAHESNNFNPEARHRTSGATGIIQFMPDTARGLGYTVDQIARMDVVEQVLRPTRAYLAEWRGRINSIEDLLAAIWGGAGGYNRSVARRRNLEDGTMITDSSGRRRLFTFADYMDRLGRGTGRSYNHSYRTARPTHTSAVQGCPICASQSASGSIVPHSAP